MPSAPSLDPVDGAFLNEARIRSLFIIKLHFRHSCPSRLHLAFAHQATAPSLATRIRIREMVKQLYRCCDESDGQAFLPLSSSEACLDCAQGAVVCFRLAQNWKICIRALTFACLGSALTGFTFDPSLVHGHVSSILLTIHLQPCPLRRIW